MAFDGRGSARKLAAELRVSAIGVRGFVLRAWGRSEFGDHRL